MALLKKEAAGKVAVKSSINFADIGKKQEKSYVMLVPVLLILLAVGVLVAKFAFLDRLDQVKQQEEITNGMQKELDDANAKVSSFGSLEKDYVHYTYSGMSTEEITRSNRIKILALLDQVVSQRCTINSWKLKGNTMSLNVSAKEKNDISRVKALLEQSPLVQVCTLPSLSTTKTGSVGDEDNVVINGTLKIQFNPEDRKDLLPTETKTTQTTEPTEKGANEQ